jgi:hypothetical protein
MATPNVGTSSAMWQPLQYSAYGQSPSEPQSVWLRSVRALRRRPPPDAGAPQSHMTQRPRQRRTRGTPGAATVKLAQVIQVISETVRQPAGVRSSVSDPPPA